MVRAAIGFTSIASSVGAVSVTGAKVGDKVIFVLTSTGSDKSASFAKFVMVDDELRQTDDQLDSVAMTVLLDRELVI